MEIAIQLDPLLLRPQRISKKKPARQEDGIAKITTILVLAHQIERAVEQGRARSYADVARSLGLTRARLTQIMALLLLAPSIQETILTQPDRVRHLSERQLRPITREVCWLEQTRQFEKLPARA